MPKLKKLIIKNIKENGPVSYRDYIAECLYNFSYGYYKTKKALGRDGDFYTSAHLGSLMGKVLAGAASNYLKETATYHIVEIGAGEGFLAKDILDFLSKEHTELYNSITYHFIEQNTAIYKRVKKNLVEHESRFIFYDEIHELKPLKSAFVFSNELFDAFPVHLTECTSEGLMEVKIGFNGQEYTKELSPLSDQVKKEVQDLSINIKEGCQGEINTDLGSFYKILSEKISSFRMISIDYGYTQDELYHPERKNGTLMGYHKHKAYENILQMEGEMDITSHVNFDALIYHGSTNGIESISFKNQRKFLIDNGLFDLFKNGTIPSPREAHELKSILLPTSMGDVFKVLIQEKK